MSTVTIELSDDAAARLEAASAAQQIKPAQWAREAVEKALPVMSNSAQAVDGKGWPIGYFEKYGGCLDGDDWQPPADSPPEPAPAP